VYGRSIEQLAWGILGATAAFAFAVWMFFFPESIPERFAWDVQPRLSQAFIGAGYVFRTLFFLAIAFGRDWLKLRWMIYGNLVFTGVLLLATFWHAEQFNWNPSQTLAGHFWVILYIFEPVTMLYLIPRGIRAAKAPVTGGPVHRLVRAFLVFTTGLLLMHGLLLVLNPDFAGLRWPWELNPLDARIMAAWFLGWSAWCGTMAFARDWDEIRLPAFLFVVNGAALLATILVFRDEFSTTRTTTLSYQVGIAVLTALMVLSIAWQERRRPRQAEVPGPEPEPATA
jgi:hypothetical protein